MAQIKGVGDLMRRLAPAAGKFLAPEKAQEEMIRAKLAPFKVDIGYAKDGIGLLARDEDSYSITLVYPFTMHQFLIALHKVMGASLS